jgi:hypothetical protein
MRDRWRTITISLLCLLILAACGGGGDDEASTPEASDSPRLRVTVSEGLVFQRPWRESEVLFRLIEGDQLVPLAQTEPDTLEVIWYQVGQGDQFGWIAGSQVEVSGDLSGIRLVTIQRPATEEPDEGPVMIVPDGEAFAIIVVDDTIVYDAPDPNAAERARLAADDTAQIIGRQEADENGEAYLFLLMDGEPLGWVRASDVRVAGNLNDVVIVEAGDVPLSQTLPTVTVEVAIQQSATPRASLIPTRTPDLASTSEFAPTATDVILTPTGLPTQTPIPELLPGSPPPLSITLPQGWQTAHILVPLNSVYFQGELPISIYRGPLGSDVVGTLWIAWGFPNVTSPTGSVNLYGDGVQLLRGMIFDSQTCEIGLGGEQRDYQVGGLAAVGTIYSAVNCEGSTDIAGFFAVLEVGGGNFAFFVGVEPVTATDVGLPQMQAILDSIVFEDAE